MVNTGAAYCVPGNHDMKLHKFLSGKTASLHHGFEVTVKEFETKTESFKNIVRNFLFKLVSHLVFDNGKLVVSHAGLTESMQGRGSGAVRSFCLFGETTGEIDEFGLPVRYNWAKEYRGNAKVVYGHTPVPLAEWLNRTICIDTGCVFGGKLTALRYPEEMLVSVKAKKEYYKSFRPINFEEIPTDRLSSQQEYDDLLNIDDVTGKRIIQTRLRNNITIREDNSILALEMMSRFAINPKWLIYLPPTMSPCETSELSTFLEHPYQALNYYHHKGIERVVCEEKHMGSRAIVVVCKDEETALKRFGIEGEGIGACYTRTGRNFFNDTAIEKEFLLRINKCLTSTGFWEKFETNWVCLDTELMPWSVKAQSLLKEQYASVGAAAGAALPDVVNSLKKVVDRGILEAIPYYEKFMQKNIAITKYIDAYRNYCWPVNSLEDYKLAPFHILATEGQVHANKNHEWHTRHINEICNGDKQLFKSTSYLIVDLNNPVSYNNAVEWWLKLTEHGGEGMVVKPYEFVAYGNEELVQPAVKCRGREYLRIIYGPEYDQAENIIKLKHRSVSKKRSLAIREFALGIEALERFVRQEPLRRIHESVFGILALESEEVDPRL
jgi:polynucleotide kinase-phosphatase